jgi:putative PEP-CTERM system TPR-repeat lipoprotein
VQLAADDKDGARQSLNRALAIKPDLVEAQRALIGLHVNAGRPEDALVIARTVQKQRPRESLGYLYEGDIHASRKAWREAVAAYRTGLKQAGTPDLAIKLHSALVAGGNVTEADKFRQGWVKEHPKDAVFVLYLAELATAKGDYAGAAAGYRSLLEAQPDNPILLNNYAWVAGKLRDPKALEYAERANKLAPDQPPFMDTLGVLLIEKGDVTRGVDLLQKAVAIAPDAAGIRLNLARGLIKAGQKDAARKELDTLAKLGEKFPGQAEVARLTKEL